MKKRIAYKISNQHNGGRGGVKRDRLARASGKILRVEKLRPGRLSASGAPLP
jgi:hypothetical protein